MKIKSTPPVTDLKEPIKSTDFASLESIKNDRKTIGLKSVSDLQDMPRADQQGTFQKAMAEAAKQQSSLKPGDWQWLREAYKQAVLADELQRRAERQARLEDIKISDEEHARLLADLRLSRNLAANAAADRELYRVRGEQLIRADREYQVRGEQLIRADREWREWIDKIDRKTLANKRELYELFMRTLGYKLGYIRQAWNQKHLTEIQRSLTEIALNRQAENQRLHLQHMLDLDKMKQEMIRQTANSTVDLLNETRIAKLLNIREWRELTQTKHAQDVVLLLLRSMGFKPGFLPLPSKQLELDEKVEKIARMKIEIEHNRRVDLEEFRTKLAALQSSALSIEHKEIRVKKEKHLEASSDQPDLETPQHVQNGHGQTDMARNKDIDLNATQKTQTEIKPLNSGAKTLSGSKNEPSEPSSPAMQSPPHKPKLFKPAFSSIATNSADLKEQNDSLDRLALDKKREQLENVEAVNLKMSQLQAASQLLQSSLVNSDLNKAAPTTEASGPDIRQKIKAAK